MKLQIVILSSGGLSSTGVFAGSTGRGGNTVMEKMEEMELPTVEATFFILMAEGATIYGCPLNLSLFNAT